MAYEVFDDVAFHFVIFIIVSVVLLPWTAWKVYCGYTLRKELNSDDKLAGATECRCKECIVKDHFLTMNRRTWRRHISLKNLIFLLMWVFYLYLIFDLPALKTQELTTFDPFKILDIEVDATEAQIKKAYKKMAIKYHPDKNKDPNAELEFVKVAKAYETLTDPAAKENLEKFGNADGFQGVSVTIGLPSWLTKKDNELPVLMIYGLALFLAPFFVWMWWRNAKNFDESGVHNLTMMFFYQNVTEHMNPRQLLDVLCLAVEYRPLARMPLNQKDYEKLTRQTKEMVLKSKQRKLEYIVRANIIFLAYINRLDIPPSMQPHLRLLQKHMFKLLNKMLELTIARKLYKPAGNIIELMQILTQAMLDSDDPLYQIPYMAEDVIKHLKRHRLNAFGKFLNADEETRNELLSKFFGNKMLANINHTCNQFPRVALSEKHFVQDEAGIYERDLVTIEVKMSKVSIFGGTIMQDEKKELKEPEATSRSEPKPSSSESEVASDPNNQQEEQVDTNSSADDQNDGEEKLTKRERRLREIRRREQELTDLLPTVEKKKKADPNATSEVVHCPYFRFPKRERWHLLLLAQREGRGWFILIHKKLPNFSSTEEIEMQFMAGPPGKHNFQLHAKCDSYRGCDFVLDFSIVVSKKPTRIKKRDRKRLAAEEKAASAHLIDDDDDDFSDEDFDEDEILELEEDEYDPKWYYLYGESFGELVLNVIVLGVLGLVVQNWLVTNGYWAQYFAPIVDRIYLLADPLIKVIYPVIQPVYEPFVFYLGIAMDWLSNMLTRELPPKSI